MAKQAKHNQAKKVIRTNAKKASQPEKQFWGLEEFLQKNERTAVLVCMALCLVFSFLLFNMRISEGGDDSGYIHSAWNFLKLHKYPFWQGPLYPLTLSVFISLFGINLYILKSLSIVFALGNVWFTYLAFRRRIPYLVLFTLLFFLSVNSFFQYYASQTYTESFFLFLQSLTLYFVMQIIDTMPANKLAKEEKASVDTQSKGQLPFKSFLVIGVLFTLLSLAKSIAFVCIIPLIVFFLFYKSYRYALYTFLSFLLFKCIYEFGIKLFYVNDSAGQMHDMLKKYHGIQTDEMETFTGMFVRFYANFQQFLSVSVLKILNMRSALTMQPETFLAYVVAIILLLTVVFSYRSNRYVFFSGLYLLVLCGGIFFGVQADNKQDRLMLIVMPFIFIVLVHGLYRFAIKSSVLRFYFFIFLLIYLSVNVYSSVNASVKNFTALKMNLKGDKYYGYTDDWVNYLKMSTYCGDSLPPNSLVATRKAAMSFIYAKEMEFYSVPHAFSTDADTILSTFKRNKVTHVLLGSLRMNPQINNGQIIGTLHSLLNTVGRKYPNKLALVKQIGESEPSYLYKINY